MQEEYRRKNGAAAPSLHKLVDFESDAITLDIPVEGVTIKGWEIVPLVPPVVSSCIHIILCTMKFILALNCGVLSLAFTSIR